VVQDAAGNEYDLSALTRTTTNWLVPEIKDGRGTGVSYELNICRGLVQSLGEQCPQTVGACQRTSDSHYSLGAPVAPQVRQTGRLILFSLLFPCASPFLPCWRAPAV
jgi:hypothetical protein